MLCCLLYCRYEAGDHVAVFPTNDYDLVAGLERKLNADFGQVFSLNSIDGEIVCLI